MSKYLKNTAKRSKKFPRLTLPTVLVAAAILTIAAVTVVSRQKASANGSGEAERSSQVAGKPKRNFTTVKVAGQDVQVDGQTGQIQELTPEEAQKMAAALKQMVNQSTEDLKEVHHPDGSVSVDLDGHFQNVTVARVNKDGSVTQSCVDNPKAAGAFFGIDPKLIENQPGRGPVAPKKAERDQ